MSSTRVMQRARWGASPLAGSLARAANAMPYATLIQGEPDRRDAGWLMPESLAERDPGERVIKRIAGKTNATFTVAATYTFRYAIANALRLAGYLYAAERRVPVLRGNLLLEDREWLQHIAVLEPRAVVCAGDEPAGESGIEIVANHAALTDALFREAAALVEPLLAGLASRKLMSRVNGWASALDYLAYGFQAAGRDGLGLDQAWALWDRAVAGREFPTRRRPRRFQYEVDGADDELLVRSGCCLYFTLPHARELGERRYCTSCYIRTDEQRLQILVEYERRPAAEAAAAKAT